MRWSNYPRKQKYANKPTFFKGRVYDSKGEAGLAMEIHSLIQQGKLSKVEPQKKFDLYGKGGYKICTHIVDFLVTKPDGTKEVWEYKGVFTPAFQLKRRLFTDNFSIPYWVITSKGRKMYSKFPPKRSPKE